MPHAHRFFNVFTVLLAGVFAISFIAYELQDAPQIRSSIGNGAHKLFENAAAGFGSSKPASSSSRNIAIGSYVTWHTDIWLSLWSHLEGDGCEVRVHRSCKDQKPDCERYLYGQFEELAGLGVCLNKSALLPQKDFIQDINKAVFSNGKMADVVVLPTAVQDMADFGEQLWKAWQAREANNKFVLLVVNHQSTAWPENRFGQLFLESGHLRILTISEHVAKNVRKRLDGMVEAGKTTQAASDSTAVMVVVPIFKGIQPWVSRTRALYHGDQHRTLTRAVISGGFYSYKRDYLHIFQDLERSLGLDPSAWGYRYDSHAKRYVIDETMNTEDAFQLWMVGSTGDFGQSFKLNPNLTEIVRTFIGPGQKEYNELMLKSDILLPAFLEPGWGYLDSVASGAIQRSLELNIACLMDKRMLEAYTFLDPDLAVTRPTGMSEVEAIRVLREADLARSHIGASDSKHTFWFGPRQRTESLPQTPTVQLVAKGWNRPAAAWEDALDTLYQHNVLALRKLTAPVPVL